ncbi:toll/interleukin-1 receptor-like protein [Rutidosis leptorrhynchoides]|uniref:toll/interleukin-1 receptor-like protein n=1 Tax=Rutidosis leptorrhynchoides TaxID=125765 RepID=UPI003A990767
MWKPPVEPPAVVTSSRTLLPVRTVGSVVAEKVAIKSDYTDLSSSMASSSSSQIMASTSEIVNSYDVFLSFRGEDTRHSFADHLYDALTRAGILTFRDNEEIKRGEEISREIKRAIKGSRASIVVLSENYGTSTWCLDELLLILEQRRECNHFVLPVFYHVDPSEVRKQAVEVKSGSRWTVENVKLWKTGLMELADLAGMVLNGYDDTLSLFYNLN